MKAKDEFVLNTLRYLKSEIQYELTKTGAKELPDVQMIQILKKSISQRLESANDYRKAGRTDLAEKEEKEKSIIEKYLPEEVSEEEIQSNVQEAIQSISPKGIQDKGKVMGFVMSKLKGKNVDGSKVSQIVERTLKSLP